MSRVLTLHPPAKINLTLRVGARRDDGYHDVRTLLQSIALADTLPFTTRRGPFVLDTRAPGCRRTARIWSGARRSCCGARSAGPAIRATCTCARESDSGGGRSRRRQRRCGRGARRPERALGSAAATPRAASARGELGSDVPFFLHGGTALGAGRGDELYPVDDAGRLGVVVIKPSFGVSTADAYRWLDEDRGRRARRRPAPSREIDLGWPDGPIRLVNDLEGPVARRHPVIRRDDRGVPARKGASAAAMTGSGSAVFGLFSEARPSAWPRKLQRPDWLVCLTRTLTRREAARRAGL